MRISDWSSDVCSSDLTLGINLWGVIHGCHVFLPQLREQGRGGIINVASAAGFTAAPEMAAYNVSKAGVVSLSETLAAELSGTDELGSASRRARQHQYSSTSLSAAKVKQKKHQT